MPLFCGLFAAPPAGLPEPAGASICDILPSSVNGASRAPVPCRRLPVRDDAVVAAIGTCPRDALVGPEPRLDAPRAWSAPRTTTTPNNWKRPSGRLTCRAGNDRRHVLGQPASRAGQERVKAASLVYEVGEIRDPRVPSDPAHLTRPLRPCLCPPNTRVGCGAPRAVRLLASAPSASHDCQAATLFSAWLARATRSSM